MRFTRTRSYGPFEDTRRKRLALARKQRLEREALPLFAEQIAEQQPDADTVMAQRAVQWDQYQQATRDRKAARWREARRRLFSYGDNVRPLLRRLWAECPYPGTPEYCLDFFHGYDTGRIDPENPPWVYRGPGILPIADYLGIVNRSRARQGLPPLAKLPAAYGNTGDQDAPAVPGVRPQDPAAC